MVILTHGGVDSPLSTADGTQRAADLGKANDDAFAMAIAATCALEDDPRFNAGTGSNFRLDGETIQMDAAVMTSDGRSGAVACIERVRNPVLVAAAVRERTPHLLLVGPGATAFARRMGHADHDPGTPERHERLVRARALLAEKRFLAPEFDAWRACIDRDGLKALWNFDGDYPGDTVGAVTRDDHGRFAAAASTGGTLFTLRGRVGDTPLIGCGLYAGPHGAVACTGVGEEIVRRFVARTVYDALARGEPAAAAIDSVLRDVPQQIPIGVIAVGARDHAIAANRPMPTGVAT